MRSATASTGSIAQSAAAPELASHLLGPGRLRRRATSVANLRKLEEQLGRRASSWSRPADSSRSSAGERTPRELEAIAEAARLADQVYEEVLERGARGAHRARGRPRRPCSAIRELRRRALVPGDRRGRPRTARCRTPTRRQREIGAGELVVWDMGAIVDGYCSDCTRTFAAGEPDDEAREVYELVEPAQAAAPRGDPARDRRRAGRRGGARGIATAATASTSATASATASG